MHRREFILSSASLGLLANSESRAQGSAGRPGKITVGDARLQIELTYGAAGLVEKSFLVDGTQLPGLSAGSWVADLNGEAVTPRGRRARLVKSDGSAPARRAVFAGDTPTLGWELQYELTGLGRVTKTLTLHPHRDGT